jgi:hypothetical protein
MAKPLVKIRKTNRELITVENVAIATDTDHAKHILDLAIALKIGDMADVKVAEYTLDGKMIFGYLRQADGLHELTPSK